MTAGPELGSIYKTAFQENMVCK